MVNESSVFDTLKFYDTVFVYSSALVAMSIPYFLFLHIHLPNFQGLRQSTVQKMEPGRNIIYMEENGQTTVIASILRYRLIVMCSVFESSLAFSEIVPV